MLLFFCCCLLIRLGDPFPPPLPVLSTLPHARHSMECTTHIYIIKRAHAHLNLQFHVDKYTYKNSVHTTHTYTHAAHSSCRDIWKHILYGLSLYICFLQVLYSALHSHRKNGFLAELFVFYLFYTSFTFLLFVWVCRNFLFSRQLIDSLIIFPLSL